MLVTMGLAEKRFLIRFAARQFVWFGRSDRALVDFLYHSNDGIVPSPHEKI